MDQLLVGSKIFETWVGASNFPVDQNQFITKVKEFLSDSANQKIRSSLLVGIIGNELKFTAIKAIAKQRPFQPLKDMEPVYNLWEALEVTTNIGSETGMKMMYQTALEGWPKMYLKNYLIEGAVQGIIIAVLFAFIVLTIATLNIFISFLAILSIAGILISVLGIIA